VIAQIANTSSEYHHAGRTMEAIIRLAAFLAVGLAVYWLSQCWLARALDRWTARFWCACDIMLPDALSFVNMARRSGCTGGRSPLGGMSDFHFSLRVTFRAALRISGLLENNLLPIH